MLSRPHVLSVVSEPLHLGDSCHVYIRHIYCSSFIILLYSRGILCIYFSCFHVCLDSKFVVSSFTVIKFLLRYDDEI